jgi:hypothetical protein
VDRNRGDEEGLVVCVDVGSVSPYFDLRMPLGLSQP